MDQNEVEILLVEDNEDDAELTIRALKKCNILNRLLHVRDGAEALEFVFSTGNYSSRKGNMKPKVILLDLNMPKLNGIEVLRAIKSNEATRSIPVVILTSSKESPDVDSCYQLGANSFIVKPVGFENFTKAISELGFYWLLSNHQPR